jgi:Ca-activated chloride channel family protein
MHIEAHLDVDLIAVETDDEVSVLIELTAPAARPPDPDAVPAVRTLQVVLDRSGSMGGDRIDGAVTSLLALVDRLDPADNFGLVTFNNDVKLVAAAGLLADKPAVKHAIASIYADGGTDLSAGYLRGIQEVRRIAGRGGATLLLISDGHANAGVVDPGALAGIAAEANRHGVVTSTLGWGLGYDERLLSAIARGGSGNELFAEDSDAAIALIAGEVEGLLSQTAQAASVLIGVSEHVRHVRIVNELPTTATDRGLIAELGSFYAGETRKLLLTFTVPAVAALGLTEIATLEFTYVELPALKQHTVTVPVHVNVVPGDQAAGRVPNATVRTELVYQQVQQAKKRASARLTEGDLNAALVDIDAAQELVDTLLSGDDLPPDFAADLAEEAESLRYLSNQAQFGSLSTAAKYSSMDSSSKSHKRGRPTSPRRPPKSGTTGT